MNAGQILVDESLEEIIFLEATIVRIHPHKFINNAGFYTQVTNAGEGSQEQS